MWLKIRLLLMLMLLCQFGFAQTYSNLDTREKDTTDYKYILPIMGKQAHAMGFDLPYSAGIGINTLWQRSDIIISNLNVGFNGSEMYNIDELVRFNTVTSESYGVNVRPDVWILPFLNIYGIMARAHSTTNVDVGIFIPRTDSITGEDYMQEMARIQTNPEFNSTSIGFGMTPTVGFFGGWLALDMNLTWTDVDALDKSVFVFVFDPRIGKTFNFSKPERNLSVWVGGFRLKVNRDTKGSLPLIDVMDTESWHNKIDNGMLAVGDAQTELDAWWNSLSPIEQANPVNSVQHNLSQTKLELASNVLVRADDAVDTAENSTINYKLDKKQKSMWNFMIGSQFQINKHFMIRGEYGFVTSRQHVLCGLQYRFGL